MRLADVIATRLRAWTSSASLALMGPLAMSLVSAESPAATFTWVNPAGGSWNLATNWSPAQVPPEFSSIVLPTLASPYTVLCPASPDPSDLYTVAELTVEAGVTLDMAGPMNIGDCDNAGRMVHLGGNLYDAFWNRPGGLIEVDQDELVRNSGQLVNDGVIRVGPVGGGMLDLNEFPITGTGEIVLLGGGIIFGSNGFANGPDHTIRGHGTVCGAFVNQGEMVADQPGTFGLSLCGNAWNQGTMRAIAGARIQVPGVRNDGGVIEADGGIVEGYPTNANGVIRALPGGMTFQGTIFNDGGSIIAEGEIVTSAPIIGGTLYGPAPIRLGSTTLTNVTVATGADVRLEGAATLQGPSLTNWGVVTAFASVLVNSNTEMAGTGEFHLLGGNITTSSPTVQLTNAAGHHVRGRGGVVGPFINHGVVDANAINLPLTLSGTWTNDGVLRATNDGMLRVNGGVGTNTGDILATGGSILLQGAVVLENTGGRIIASASDVRTAGTGCTVHGGTLESVAPGSFRNYTAAVLDDVELLAGSELRTEAGGITSIAGASLTRHGTFRVLGTLRANAALTLLGDGEVMLEGGTLDAPAVQLGGGVLGGVGIVTGDVTNAARVSPGGSPGTLHIQGDYAQTGAGRIKVELGGVAPGQFDVLQVDGAATLDGTIAAALFGAYDPAVGEEFVVMTFASRSGDFSTFENFDLGGGPEVLLHDYPAPGGALRLRVVPEVYTGVGDPRLPERVRLYGFTTRGRAALALELPTPREVSIGLYDAAGRRVAVLQRGGVRAAGRHVLPVEVQGLPSGVYFARAVLGNGAEREVHRSRVVLAD